MDEKGIYNAPSNSLRSREEPPANDNEPHGITPRKKGVGSFFRQLVKAEDSDGLVHIFGNAMINAIGDAIDEVTGNLSHRAKTVLYGTEDYDRGRRGNSRDGRYASYRDYYDRNNRNGSNRDRDRGSQPEQTKEYKRWRYDEIFFDDRVFRGMDGARQAAMRVIKAMEDRICDCDNVSIGDYIRYCKEEDPNNPYLTTEYTDERWGWTDEAAIASLRPIKVNGGYIIELPKPVSLY